MFLSLIQEKNIDSFSFIKSFFSHLFIIQTTITEMLVMEIRRTSQPNMIICFEGYIRQILKDL